MNYATPHTTGKQLPSGRSFSVKRLADKHDLSKGTIYNEIARGKLATIKVGRRRLITAEQEAEWLKLCEVSS